MKGVCIVCRSTGALSPLRWVVTTFPAFDGLPNVRYRAKVCSPKCAAVSVRAAAKDYKRTAKVMPAPEARHVP